MPEPSSTCPIKELYSSAKADNFFMFCFHSAFKEINFNQKMQTFCYSDLNNAVNYDFAVRVSFQRIRKSRNFKQAIRRKNHIFLNYRNYSVLTIYPLTLQNLFDSKLSLDQNIAP